MKFLVKLVPIVLIAFMINCSKSSTPGISIAGTWTGVSSGTSGCTNASDNYTSTYACPATASNSCITITFNSNGSFTSNYSAMLNGTLTSGTTSGTYSLKGTSITISTSSNGQTTTETDTFIVSGNTLTVTSAKNSTTGCVNTTILTK